MSTTHQARIPKPSLASKGPDGQLTLSLPEPKSPDNQGAEHTIPVTVDGLVDQALIWSPTTRGHSSKIMSNWQWQGHERKPPVTLGQRHYCWALFASASACPPRLVLVTIDDSDMSLRRPVSFSSIRLVGLHLDFR